VILVLCTANQCRSPLAAASLRAHLAGRDPALTVESAGLGASGYPATSPTVDAARALGLDLTPHRSRQLDVAIAGNAELIVGMERQHVREAVVLDQRVWSRAFTLKELVRRASVVGQRAPGESLDEWLHRVGEGRRPADLLGQSREDDVADPTTDPLADYATMAREIDTLVRGLVDLAWPAPPGRISAS
jgi:protein-tyrosine phosphatase